MLPSIGLSTAQAAAEDTCRLGSLAHHADADMLV